MKKTKKVNNRQKLIAGVVVILLFLGALFLLRRSMISPQVAEIAVDERPPENCISQVESISFGKECNEGSFLNSKYICKNGQVAERNATVGTCQSYTDIMSEAIRNCGTTCGGKLVELPPEQYSSPMPTAVSTSIPRLSPTPTPVITPSPTPIPTSVATSSSDPFSCKVRVFKLKPSDDPKANPTAYYTPDREVNPGSTSVSFGDRFAYLIESSTSKDVSNLATVSAVTSNLHGSDEPIKVVATTKSCSSTDSWKKYMSCTEPAPDFKANSPVLSGIGMTVEVADNVYLLGNTSTEFAMTYRNSSFDKTARCSMMMLASQTISQIPTGCTVKRPFCAQALLGKECPSTIQCEMASSSPSPDRTSAPTTDTPTTVQVTSTPMPSIKPGCEIKERFCIQSIIGGDCPKLIECPNPSLAPTPSATPNTTSSPLCGKQLNTWKYRESCGKGRYRYVDFTCIGDKDTQTKGSSSSCNTESVWLDNARSACRDMACPTLTPSPSMSPASTTLQAPNRATPSIKPQPVVKQSFVSCYRSCRKNRSSLSQCVRTCL